MLDDKGSAGTLRIDKIASLAERLEEQLRNKDKEGEKSFQLLTQELQAIEVPCTTPARRCRESGPTDIHIANDEESLAGEHRVGAMEVDLQVSMADAGETSAASIRAPVDESVLKNIFGDDEALFDEILTDFEVSSEGIVVELREAVNSGTPTGTSGCPQIRHLPGAWVRSVGRPMPGNGTALPRSCDENVISELSRKYSMSLRV